MNTVNPPTALVEGHLRFLADAISCKDEGKVTEWVNKSLMSESSSGVTSINKASFFEAEKLLIRGYIAGNEFKRIEALLSAVDNEKLKDSTNYKKLKLNQCKVLADGVKMAERFLRENDAMHKDLSKLLQDKQSELQSLTLEGKEKDFRDQKLSTSINSALEIVQVCPAGSSMGKES